jgi:hypothetical protein
MEEEEETVLRAKDLCPEPPLVFLTMVNGYFTNRTRKKSKINFAPRTEEPTEEPTEEKKETTKRSFLIRITKEAKQAKQ